MQLNTLNRVIALFLVGGLVIAIAAFAGKSELQSFINRNHGVEVGPAGGVFLAVALLSVTALLGSVIDAVGNLTVRRFIRAGPGTKRLWATLFWCGREFDEQDRWRKVFETALATSDRYKAMVSRPEMLKPLSAGLFFRTTENELAEWLRQHHSMYHLSANFAVILIACAPWLCVTGSTTIAASFVGIAYLLSSFAVDNYLYTYQLSFRNAYLALEDMRSEATIKPPRE